MPVLAGGTALALGMLAYAVRRLDPEGIPRVGMLAAVFFVASLIMVPVPPSSVHLMLSGLMGLILGWGILPAVAVGLIMQLVFFGYGGVTSLGINLVNIAAPGLFWAALLGKPLRAAKDPKRVAILAGALSALSAASTGLLVALSLYFSAAEFQTAAQVILVTYAPLVAGEALVGGAIVGFLQKVKPDLLDPSGGPQHG